jgi:hypothetical protein
MKRRTTRARLGDLADGVYREIYNMTPRQRRAAARALYACTSTNCSASLYRLRTALLSFINDASSSRERRGRERALARLPEAT